MWHVYESRSQILLFLKRSLTPFQLVPLSMYVVTESYYDSVNLMPQTLARIFVESFLWVRAQCLGIGILGGLDESLRVSEGWSFVIFFACGLGT